MKMHVVCVYDKKTGYFDKPGYARHLADAIRDWDHLRKDKQTKIGMNPEDFELWKLGSFDEQHGTFESDKEQLASGV